MAYNGFQPYNEFGEPHWVVPQWALDVVVEICSIEKAPLPNIEWDTKHKTNNSYTIWETIHIDALGNRDQEMQTLLHELTHYLVGSNPDKKQRRKFHHEAFSRKAWALFTQYQVTQYALEHEYPEVVRDAKKLGVKGAAEAVDVRQRRLKATRERRKLKLMPARLGR